MKEQLVSFEVAVLAKEKGFNYECNFVYAIADIDYFYSNNSVKKGDCWDRGMYLNYNKKDAYTISAPTQALLQKWLRKKHNLHVLMNVGMNNGKKQTFYSNVFLFGKNKYIGKFRSKTSIYTYEEALEIALFQALKLTNNE